LRIHRIVFAKYVGVLLAGMTIDHIDGNRHNNHANNLRQVSYEVNNSYSFVTSKRVSSRITCSNKLNMKLAKELEDLFEEMGFDMDKEFLDFLGTVESYSDLVLRIDVNGNIGIGTTAPDSAMFMSQGKKFVKVK